MFANFRCPLEAVRLGRVYTLTNTFSHALPTRSSYSTCSRLICPMSCALSSSLAFHWQHAFAHARQTFVLSAAGASEDYKQFLYQNETNCGNLSDLSLPLTLFSFFVLPSVFCFLCKWLFIHLPIEMSFVTLPTSRRRDFKALMTPSMHTLLLLWPAHAPRPRPVHAMLPWPALDVHNIT